LFTAGATAVRRKTELREQNFATLAKPARQTGEERQQPVVSWAVSPVRIDRIAVHREEVAAHRRLVRPEPPVLFEVFHMQPDRDERLPVDAAYGGRDAGEPLTRRRATTSWPSS
jgi:hypothetical protein